MCSLCYNTDIPYRDRVINQTYSTCISTSLVYMPSLGIERAERESVTVISVIYQLGCIAVAFAMIMIISWRLKLSFGRAESVTVMCWRRRCCFTSHSLLNSIMNCSTSSQRLLTISFLTITYYFFHRHQHQLVIGERLSCIAGVFSLLQHRYSIS